MTNQDSHNQPELERIQTDGTLSAHHNPLPAEISCAVSDYGPQARCYPRHFAVKIKRAADKSPVQQLVTLKKLHPPLTKFANAELLDRFKISDEWVIDGLLAEEAEMLIRQATEKGFNVSLLNFDDSKVPYALRGIYRMLVKQYPLGVIPKSEYAPLISVLHEHMSDRNLAEVLSLFTGKENALALNDIYKSVTTHRPNDKAFDSVKQKLIAQGIATWTEEVDLSDFEHMWTVNQHRYALYEVQPNRYAIMEVDARAMVLIEEERIAEKVIQQMLDHGNTILDKSWLSNK
ncbi:DUF3349 domain-containing protein [Saccharibacillus sacchari]|uniref:DUF3349 domain-containing protein n=1 Tax=Saccharibacillus sacchari TaxID=456493 RepID=UPI00055FA947|nr:DUF3349 domain-containing protein [Saccharibacillus sacchari]